MSNNCYILSGDGVSAVVIDPSGQYNKIDAALKEAGLNVAAILLTHGHFDHYGAAKRLRDNYGAPIYVHPADADKIGEGYGLVNAERFTPDRALTDGDVLHLAGLDITVIHTPGHTGGGVCFLTEGRLFSGDTLFHGDVGRTDFPTGNAAELARSIRERLYTLPLETEVLPGHEEATTIGEEALHNTVIRKL
jgi:glyoxylase-like metal-dependent hydrolase (beta-lactamase superfamily II)